MVYDPSAPRTGVLYDCTVHPTSETRTATLSYLNGERQLYPRITNAVSGQYNRPYQFLTRTIPSLSYHVHSSSPHYLSPFANQSVMGMRLAT